MLNKKQVDTMAMQVDNMKLLIQTYEEVAGIHMRKIRSVVLTNRGFIDDLEEIYQQLQSSYAGQVSKMLAKKRNKSLHQFISPKNGKAVSVFLSSSTRLYGEIVQQTFTLFSDFISKNNTDIIVVGKLGQSLMKESDLHKQYIYKDLSDVDIKSENVVDLLSTLLQYEKIYLFYGKFETVASQKPYMLDVYGQQAAEQILGAHTTSPHIRYLFEPSLEKILQFFEQQIFGTIIEQTLKESELAKFAARMVALDKATDNINAQMKKISMQRKIVLHHLQNQKQQQALAGRSLWKLT